MIWSGVLIQIRTRRLGKTEFRYDNLRPHAYLVCESCRKKRRQCMLWTALAHIGLILILAVLLTLVFQGAGGLANALCMASTIALVPALLSVLVFLVQSPVNKLKRIAVQECRQADETGRIDFSGLSEQEYRRQLRQL